MYKNGNLNTLVKTKIIQCVVFQCNEDDDDSGRMERERKRGGGGGRR